VRPFAPTRPPLIASDREAVNVRTLSGIFRFFAFWLPEICGTTVNIRNTYCGPLFGWSLTVAPDAPKAEPPRPFPHKFRVPPMRAENPMQTTTLPDFSVDFMTWLNTELRKRIEADDDSRSGGLVNRLKNYFGRPIETETSES
jgi:hypothetical protein